MSERKKLIYTQLEPLPGQLTVQSECCGGTATLALRGSVDRYTAPILNRHIGFALERGAARIELDARGAAVPDDGIAVLAVALAEVARRGAAMTIAGARNLLSALETFPAPRPATDREAER